jgi:hypothetical protein
MKTLITEFMPEDPCGGDVAGGSVLVPGCVFRHFYFQKEVHIMNGKQTTNYRPAFMNLLAGKCPPNFKEGEKSRPCFDGEDCETDACYSSWLVEELSQEQQTA